MEKNITNNDEVEIDLRQVFAIILSNIVIIVLVGVILGLAALLGSKLLIKPTYESTTSLYVLNRQNQGTTTYNDVQLSTQLTKDYAILVTSRTVTEKVIGDLNLDIDNDKLAKMISVTTPTDTRVLEITVSSHDQYQAKQIADKVAEISAASISDIMKTDQVSVIEEANLPDRPSSPNSIRNAAIAGVIGIVMAMAFFVVRFILNDTICTPEEVEKYLGMSTLALIPLSEDLDDKKDESRKKGKKKRKETTSTKGEK